MLCSSTNPTVANLVWGQDIKLVRYGDQSTVLSSSNALVRVLRHANGWQLRNPHYRGSNGSQLLPPLGLVQ
jgi:uncharacterized protein YhdP